ncbi:hypothetical protein DL769_000625 [Monosporascus sp. CRB-8-3]|nr:hypothetical protein DL769_000625 [Monosporascus sp. CRB-8-3]
MRTWDLRSSHGLEVDRQDPRRTAGDAVPPGPLPERRVCLVLLVVVPHVVEARELGLGHYGPALAPRVVGRLADAKREDVGLAVLFVAGGQ